MALLADINSPSDLKRLNQQQLTQLAAEVRAFLVEHIAKTGGHLSPNLGVVELTFALHRVFDSPKDAIVWDTGHQAYVHKMVTGRTADFATLRQQGGLSGYPSRHESKHDVIENSHASTSLSYALGLAEARLRRREPGFVIAVIGDGALTGGMAYEALNQIAHLQPPNLIIVINDNGRSYAPTVGGLARHLSQLRVDPRYESIKDEISRLLRDLPLVTELTYTDVFGDALLAAATTHPDVCAVTAAMASSTGLLNFAKEFPDRFFDVGICEQHAVTFAAGLAMAGMRPVVCIYSTFLARAFDQTIMDVALHKLPVVFVIDRAGVTGPDRSSHHRGFELAYLRMIPNLKVAAPADATELCALLETALGTDGPIAIRYPRGPVPSTPDLPAEALPVGRWEEVRKGSEAVIFATGRMVEIAKEAAERLETMGLSCGVVNARWIKPVDPRMVEWARGVGTVVTVEDNVGAGGFGGAVLESLAPHGLAGKVRTIALPDQFLPHGKASDILREHGLDAAGVAKSVYLAVRGAVPSEEKKP